MLSAPERWTSRFVAVLLSLTVLLTIAIGISQLLFIWYVRPPLESNRAQQKRHYQSYLDDIEYISKHAFIPLKGEQKKDAGPYLNRRVYWSPASDGFPNAPLVSKDIKETLIRYRSDWMKKYQRVRTMNVDLSVFQNLSQYDHWDLEIDSPIAQLADQLQFVPPPSLPLPETNDLIALVKLRLMRGALDKDFINALKDVRALARLMLTTENMSIVLAGLAILDYERFAFRFYVDRFNLPRDAWTPVDRNFTRRAYRAGAATRSYLHLWTEPRMLEEIFLTDIEPFGFCAAVNEAFPAEFALRPLLKRRWFFELDLQSEYERLDKIFARARKTCRIRYLAELVDHRAIHTKIPGPPLLVQLPYARKVFGLRSSVLSFQGFGAYELAPY